MLSSYSVSSASSLRDMLKVLRVYRVCRPHLLLRQGISCRDIAKTAGLRLSVVFSQVIPRRTSRCAIFVVGSSLALRVITVRIVQCQQNATESPWLISSKTEYESRSKPLDADQSKIFLLIIFLWRSLTWYMKMSLRLCSLTVRFAPLLLTYPLGLWSEGTRGKWWRLAIWTIQSSGPTLIKLGQWASTRRDLFSKEFCDKLAVLHTKTDHRCWQLSDSALDELFDGRNWSSFIVSVQSQPIGSGCIAQVYKARLNVDLFQSSTGIRLDHVDKQKFVDIAIKIAKPGIRGQIEVDLAIMKTFVWMAQKILPSLLFVNPISCLNQFETVLKRQVDLRNEAMALERFSKNFDVKKTGIRFPKVFYYSKDVIIESYEGGIYANRLVTGDHELLSHQSTSIKRRIALLGARAILKMIFVDNFVHGDLHPGNILIQFNDNSNNNNQDVHRAPPLESLFAKAMDYVKGKLSWAHEPRLRITEDSEYGDEPTLVILDTGIAIEETPQNLRNLRALFSAVVDKRGYDVGKLLLIHSPEHQCSDPEKFCREVEEIVRIARSSGSLRKLNISQLLNELFSVVSRHRVSLETSFTTVVLAVMVLEGFGRSLDPDLDLFQCARPYLLSVIY